MLEVLNPHLFKIDSLRLLSNQVLLKLIHPERMHGKLWIPETAKRQNYELYRGKVIATGEGLTSPKNGRITPCDVKPGDEVLFYWASGIINVTAWPDADHRIISESAIQAVVNG